jgi:hypothetical protein
MAGVTRSVEKFNAREQLITPDIMRAQVLISREAPGRGGGELARVRLQRNDPVGSRELARVQLLAGQRAGPRADGPKL